MRGGVAFWPTPSLFIRRPSRAARRARKGIRSGAEPVSVEGYELRTENGTEVDFEALNNLLVRADVLTIGFSLFPERLLIDTRSNDRQGQLVTMTEPVGSVQERYLWLGRHRGAFGAPEAFSFFVWPHTVRNLLERNVLAPLHARLDPEAAAQLALELERSSALEAMAIASAIRGDGNWPALWERNPQRRPGAA